MLLGLAAFAISIYWYYSGKGNTAENRKPMYAFLIAQLINVIITLVVAYFLFRS